MKTFNRIAVAVALCALAGAAQAQGRGQAQTHDGFYLQLDLGGGFLKSSLEDFDIDLEGGAGQFGIALGAAVTPNFIVAGHLWGATVSDPDVSTPIGSGQADGTLTLSGIGVQLTYYFMPANVYVQATPSMTTLTADDGSNSSSTDNGFGMRLAVGKEWWVSHNWALGLNAQAAFASNNDGGVPADWQTTWFGVAFSATYN